MVRAETSLVVRCCRTKASFSVVDKVGGREEVKTWLKEATEERVDVVTVVASVVVWQVAVEVGADGAVVGGMGAVVEVGTDCDGVMDDVLVTGINGGTAGVGWFCGKRCRGIIAGKVAAKLG